MQGLGEGKSGRFVVGASNHAKFFDKVKKKGNVDEENMEQEFTKEKKNTIESNSIEVSSETKLENESILKGKAKKILNDALANSLKRKMEELNMMNFNNKTPLNSELFYIASLVGKDIIEDDFILVDIMETLRKGEDVVLDEAYTRKIEAKIGEISIDDLNKLLFKAFVFRRVDFEIDALKKAIEANSIYQSKIGEINANTKFELTDAILRELEMVSSVESDFLKSRREKNDANLKKIFKDEVEALIHTAVTERLVEDEVPIALNIGAPKETEKEIAVDNINNNDEMQEDKIAQTIEPKIVNVGVAAEAIGDKNENNEEVDLNEEREREEVEKLLDECRKQGEILSDRMMEYQSHAVTDEDKSDVEYARQNIFNPIAGEFKDLVELSKNSEGREQELLMLLKKNKESISNRIMLFDELIQIEEEKYKSKESIISEKIGGALPEIEEEKVELVAGVEMEIVDSFIESVESYLDKFKSALAGNEEFGLYDEEEKNQQFVLSAKTQIRRMLAMSRVQLVAEHGFEESKEKEFEDYVLKKLFQ